MIGKKLVNAGGSPQVWVSRLLVFLLVSAVARADLVCESCDRRVVVSGVTYLSEGNKDIPVLDAPAGGAETFRKEIYGSKFQVAVPHLDAGRYTLVMGFVEVYFQQAGMRMFDITCGKQVLARDVDLFKLAGGSGRICFVTNQVEFPGDALLGPLTVELSARVNYAKLNTFEVRNNSGQSLIWVRAADLIEEADLLAKTVPVVPDPVSWTDPAQSIDTRTKDLVRRLSLFEKVQLIQHHTPGVPRLGIPAYDYWNEALHGVARAGVATVFPQVIGLAATWDVPLLHDIGDVISTEARAKANEYRRLHHGDSAESYGLTFWSPNLNIFRDPRWGRGQETYGEDPFLSSQFGVAFIRGMQGDDPQYVKAMACAKHYAVHSGPEGKRHVFDANPPERDLYETYLPQFESAVREGQVGGVMGAYNSVYGQPACANSVLLTQILRQQWGFKGYIVSDCGAIFDIFANHKYVSTPEAAAAAAVKAGCEICCGVDYGALTKAVAKGLISEREIDAAVSDALKARFRLGLFDPPSQVAYAQIPITQNDTPEHEALALKAARESLVLLKNNGLLPLDRNQIKRIAVFGENADSIVMLHGNYCGVAARPVSILEGMKAMAGTNITVVFHRGCPLAQNPGDSSHPTLPDDVLAAAQSADVIIYVGGLGPQLEGEEMPVSKVGFSGGDRTLIELPAVQHDFIMAMQKTGKPVVFVNCSGSAIAMPWEVSHIPAILQAWYPGEQGGRAVAEVLFGETDPAGRLPITFYRSTDDLPDFENYSMTNRTYRYFSGKPLFAFGHGLSFTKFEYQKAGLNTNVFNPCDTIKLSFVLRNTGGRDGDEVAQAYFRYPKTAPQPSPRLSLCGFERVHLARGQAESVTIDIPVSKFRSWDTSRKQYVIVPGDYELLLGAASDDIRHQLPLEVKIN